MTGRDKKDGIKNDYKFLTILILLIVICFLEVIHLYKTNRMLSFKQRHGNKIERMMMDRSTPRMDRNHNKSKPQKQMQRRYNNKNMQNPQNFK